MRPSEWRRILVVRWSRRKRSSSVSGSVVRRSMPSSTVSSRCSSDWLRRARLRNTSLIPRRIRASPTAASMAVRRAASKAWPTRPISSRPNCESVPDSSSTGTSSPRRSRATTLGSSTPARVTADSSRPPMRRINQRAISADRITDSSRPSRPRPTGQRHPPPRGVGDRVVLLHLVLAPAFTPAKKMPVDIALTTGSQTAVVTVAAGTGWCRRRPRPRAGSMRSGCWPARTCSSAR